MIPIITIMLLAWCMLRAVPWSAIILQKVAGRLRTIAGIKKNAAIFDNQYLSSRNFYLNEFRVTPCISFINNIDSGKAYQYLNAGYAGKVQAVYQRTYYNWQRAQQEYSTTLFKLENHVLVELGDEYAEILFSNNNYGYAKALVEIFSTYKAVEKERGFEINIITQTSHGLYLKTLDIKPTMLDIGLYYNDDFKQIDELVRQRLGNENDKGIVLFHGLPGTGKTTYLRHLVGCINKKVLFVSPAVARNLMDPEFMDLLLDNPNAVLIIEDAENILMDRRYSSHSSVSNLLNISDGLLSDCLNVQIICTFNSSLDRVDDALLRKGRLIAKYEFGKLAVDKARALSRHLGFDKEITTAMTIAEIANPEDVAVVKPSMQVMGFRREVVMN